MEGSRPPHARPRHPVGLAAWLLVLGLLLGVVHAQATPLEGLLPATTVAAFHVGPASGDLSALIDVFEELGVDAARETFERLLQGFGADIADLNGGDGDIVGGILEELLWVCPELETAWDDEATAGLFGPGVLAVSLSPFNPFPAVIAAIRPADPAYFASLQDVLISCAADGPPLQQDDVSLHVLFDGTELPLVVARFDDTFVVASDPDLLRGAVRLARGSDEPSHLGTPIGRAASAITDGGLAVTLDFGALADGLRTLSGMFPVEPDEAALIDQLLTSLGSLGGVAGRVTLDPDGLRLDGVMVPDGSAGDEAIAALFACSDCGVGRSTLLPAGATGVSGQYVDLHGIVRWLDGALAGLEPLIGEPLDTRMLVGMLLGLDLDAHLLDWIGHRWHSATLATRGTDVATWLVGPGTITTVDVRSEAAARESIGAWRATLSALDWLLEDLLYEFGGMVDPFGPPPSSPLPEGGILAVREVTYRGLGYERWRIGPFTDVGVGVLDGHLVVAVPARAMQAAIDVHLGAPDVHTDARLGPVLATVPAEAPAYSIQDVAASLHELARVSDLFAAPLATTLSVALAEEMRAATWSDPWGDPWGDDPWGTPGPSGLWRSSDRYGSALLDTVPTAPLSVPGSVSAVIGTDDVLPNGDLGLVFTLEGLVEGTDVTIEMLDPVRSWNMDTYLYLYDATAGAIIADNDDAPDIHRSELLFTVEPGVRYAVVASSWGGSDVGPIELNASVSGVAQPEAEPDVAEEEPFDEPFEEPVDVPTFAELVAMFDFVTDAIDAVAERTGLAISITVVEEGVVRTTMTLPIR